MNRYLRLTATAVAGTTLMLVAGVATARTNVDISIGIPAPVYAQPQPVYVQPQPVYMQPRPVYVQPQPVYVQPRPVYYERHEHRHPHWEARGYGRHDQDRDGRPDRYDHDRDGDGVSNHRDRYPSDPHRY